MICPKPEFKNKKSIIKTLDSEWPDKIKELYGNFCHWTDRKNHDGVVCAHHIIHKSQSLNLKWDILNGIPLCNSCHSFIHKFDHDNEFMLWFAMKYPDRAKYLEQQRKQMFHAVVGELKEKLRIFRGYSQSTNIDSILKTEQGCG